jgi:predicted PurR-regulated permease PerM
MTILVAVLVPLVADDAARFAHEVPALAGRATAWLRAQGLEIPHDWQSLVSEWGEKLRDMLAGAVQAILGSVYALFDGVVTFLFGFLNLLIVPVFAFYFLMDWKAIQARTKELIPPRHRELVLATGAEIDTVVSSWVRGQLTLVMVQAVLYPIALSIVGIQLAVPIGVLAGLLTIIPYVGGIIGAILSIAMALLGWDGPGQLIGVVIVFVIMNILEGFVLTPILVGRKVGLSDAWALVAVLAGGELLGFVGVLLAIPLAAAAAVIIRRLRRAYLESRFYTDGTPEPEPEPAAVVVAEESPPS